MKKVNLYSSALLFLLLALFTACGGNTLVQAPIDTPTLSQQLGKTPVILAIGSFSEYALPQTNSGLMRPVVDHQGRVWFGEMGKNYLAMFDPKTQTFKQLTPPHGQSGIMGLAVAKDDTIWFAEQYANYLGHYFPTTGQFLTYPLPNVTTPDPGDKTKTLTLPSAPNDLVLDAQGNVWYTELNADSLGFLNVYTGQMRQYPLSAKKSVQTLDPYGITVDPQGTVWFTESSNNHLGRLNPSNGQISFFTMHGLVTQLMEVASDSHGIIWATAFASGLLLSFNPHTNTFTPYYAPMTNGGSSGLYGLTIAAHDAVWVTVTAEGVIAHLDTAAGQFLYYRIPTTTSLPLGLAVDAQQTIWFTEAGSDKIGKLHL